MNKGLDEEWKYNANQLKRVNEMSRNKHDNMFEELNIDLSDDGIARLWNSHMIATMGNSHMMGYDAPYQQGKMVDRSWHRGEFIG